MTPDTDTFPAVTLPVALTKPVVRKLPACTLPVTLANPAVLTFPAVMLPVTTARPPVVKLPPDYIARLSEPSSIYNVYVNYFWLSPFHTL